MGVIEQNKICNSFCQYCIHATGNAENHFRLNNSISNSGKFNSGKGDYLLIAIVLKNSLFYKYISGNEYNIQYEILFCHDILLSDDEIVKILRHTRVIIESSFIISNSEISDKP